MNKHILSTALLLFVSSTAFSMIQGGGGYTTSYGPIGGGTGTPSGHGGGSGGKYGGGGSPGAGPFDNPAQGPSAPGGYGGNLGGNSGHVNTNGNRSSNTTAKSDYKTGPIYGTKIPNDWKPKGDRTPLKEYIPIPLKDPYGGRGGYGKPTPEQLKWIEDDDKRIQAENEKIRKDNEIIQRNNDVLDEREYYWELANSPENIARLKTKHDAWVKKEEIRRKDALARLPSDKVEAESFAKHASPALNKIAAKRILRETQKAQSQVVSQNTTIRAELNSERVTALLEQQAAVYVRSQLDLSETLSGRAVDMANQGASPNVIKLVSDFATDVSNASAEFVGGFGKGIYTSFQKTSDALVAIAQDPTLLKNLATNIMNTVTDPSRFVDGVKDSYTTFVTVMNYGTLAEQGEMLGEFAGNAMQAMAGGEATVAGEAALGEIGESLLQTKPNIGADLARRIESAPKIATQAAELNRMVTEAKNTSPEVLSGWQRKHQITKFEDAADANSRLGFSNPPYKDGTKVIHFDTTADQQFVRVHMNGVPDAKGGFLSKDEGSWLTRKGEIQGLTPQQIADKLNLEHEPTHVTDVHVPKGTKMTRGMTHLNQ